MKKTLILACLSPLLAAAAPMSIQIYAVSEQGLGNPVGQVQIEDSQFGGVLITPALTGLPPGTHGFHVHDMPSCDPATKDGHVMSAGAAGGHLDPAHTAMHAGPYGAGHLGDLPMLIVNKDGTATTPVLAPRLKVSDFQQHTLMIHAGSDNYSDTPEALGGGGARIACGVSVTR